MLLQLPSIFFSYEILLLSYIYTYDKTILYPLSILLSKHCTVSKTETICLKKFLSVSSFVAYSYFKRWKLPELVIYRLIS